MSAEVAVSPQVGPQWFRFTLSQINSKDRGKFTRCEIGFLRDELVKPFFETILPKYSQIAKDDSRQQEFRVTLICKEAEPIRHLIEDQTQMKVEGDLLDAVNGKRSIFYAFAEDFVTLRLTNGTEVAYPKAQFKDPEALRVGDKFLFMERKVENAVFPYGINRDDFNKPLEVAEIRPASWNHVSGRYDKIPVKKVRRAIEALGPLSFPMPVKPARAPTNGVGWKIITL